MRIFFAGSLTNLQNPIETKSFYDKLAQTARDKGFEAFWAFQSGTDPIKNPEITPQHVYQVDIEKLSHSDLMVAYVGEPSTGTGEEIEYAKVHDIPVVILYRKDQHVSRMLRGNPAIKKEIVYSDDNEALSLFSQFLDSVKK